MWSHTMARSIVTNGSKGKDAFDCQRALNWYHIHLLLNELPGLLGAPLREDSNFGRSSTAVLNAFKSNEVLPEDGVADQQAWDILEQSIPADPGLPDADLIYGVASAVLLRGFRPSVHGGLDVSPRESGGGGFDDPRRGAPVFLTLQPTISRAALNGVALYDGRVGLGFPSGADAVLSEVLVLPQPWASTADHEYGGIVGFAAQYSYDDATGPRTFTIYVEYEHLITPEFPPKDSAGATAQLEVYAGLGRGMGFGSQAVGRSLISAAGVAQLPLIGFLGATQTPHVHIQSRFAFGVAGFLDKSSGAPLVDPNLVVTPIEVIITS